MNAFLIDIEASADFSADMPTLEILVGGVVVSADLIDSETMALSYRFTYSGSFPSSLSLRFNDGSGEPGRSITLESVRINGQESLTAYFSSSLLTQGQSSTINTSANDFLFGQAEPASADIGTPTVTGTNNGETLYGSPNEDIVEGKGGADTIITWDGDDAIDGGGGDDVIRGGDGNDLIYGNSGSDRLYGEDGDDLIYGGADGDFLYGGNGNDTLNGGSGDDRLNGQNGNDIMYGGAGNDNLNGGNGNDFMDGGADDDTLVGGSGDDEMYGGSGDDQLYGSAGNDEMYGEDGDDTLVGDSGDDLMYGGAGSDTMLGRHDNDEMHGGDDGDVMHGEFGDDTMYGDDGDDVLVGGLGSDILYGGAGNDQLHGHGADHITVYYATRDNPGVVYNAATNSFYQYVATSVDFSTAQAAASAITLNGVQGHLVTVSSQLENDIVQNLIGGSVWISATDSAVSGEWRWSGGPESGLQFSDIGGNAVNNMYENWAGGQPQNNTEHNAVMNVSGLWDDQNEFSTHYYVIEWEAGLMVDDAAVDTISGGAGNDVLYGYGGADVLNGDDGDDVIFGGAGSDILNGGDGDDVLHAYRGAGTIAVFSKTFGSDSEGFVYADGVFGSSGGSNNFASGAHITSDGHGANGALLVSLGGINDTDRTDISGAWQLTFDPGQSLVDTTLTFSYRMIRSGTYETNEDTIIYVDIDGTRYGLDGNDYIATFESDGDDPETDTGWVRVTVDIGNLGAGSHILSIGGYNEGKTDNDETSFLRIDDVSLRGEDGSDTRDAAESNVLNGGTGNDVLYGSAGDDTLNGDGGNDILYSGSTDTLAAQISAILAANPDVAYNSATGSFYQYVSSAVRWSDALSGASGTLINGVAGHLVHVTSAAENSYIDTLSGTSLIWMGGSDSATEGSWVFVGGPMDSISFWSGIHSGSAQNNFYTNWEALQPNADFNDEDGLVMMDGGTWEDSRTNGGTRDGYVIEWESSQLLTPTASTTLAGGDGLDNLYGSDGHDIFLFEAASAFNDIDVIHSYSATDLDRIDISDLLTGFTPGSSDVDAFARFTVSGSDLLLQVDANGTAGGSSYTSVALLEGMGSSGLNVEEMVANGLLIMA